MIQMNLIMDTNWYFVLIFIDNNKYIVLTDSNKSKDCH